MERKEEDEVFCQNLSVVSAFRLHIYTKSIEAPLLISDRCIIVAFGMSARPAQYYASGHINFSSVVSLKKKQKEIESAWRKFEFENPLDSGFARRCP